MNKISQTFKMNIGLREKVAQTWKKDEKRLTGEKGGVFSGKTAACP